jgi:hypothetical protein
MAHFIFNVLPGDAAAHERTFAHLRAGRWRVDAGEPHAGALAAGDLVLVYLGAPGRVFVGRAQVASAVHDSGVQLTDVEEWRPPVPIEPVLARIDSSSAKADFDAGVVLISANEYETAVALAREGRR